MQATSLRDFQLLKKLGEGSFGQVFLVRRKQDLQSYALKKVNISVLRQKDRQSALNQIRILASFHTDYIIGYKEAFYDPPYLCIVMEYAARGDLCEAIQQHRNDGTVFAERSIWQAMVSLGSGLKLMHEKSILHRDIKSANVFITAEEKYKLGDLNVSKVAVRGMADTQIGTPYYASPEIWGDTPYGSKSDMWSLGCVLYEMAALRPPFDAKHFIALYKKVSAGVYDRIPPMYSDDLQTVIDALMRVDPEQRLSGGELIAHPIVKKNWNKYVGEQRKNCNQGGSNQKVYIQYGSSNQRVYTQYGGSNQRVYTQYGGSNQRVYTQCSRIRIEDEEKTIGFNEKVYRMQTEQYNKEKNNYKLERRRVEGENKKKSSVIRLVKKEGKMNSEKSRKSMENINNVKKKQGQSKIKKEENHKPQIVKFKSRGVDSGNKHMQMGVRECYSARQNEMVRGSFIRNEEGLFQRDNKYQRQLMFRNHDKKAREKNTQNERLYSYLKQERNSSQNESKPTVYLFNKKDQLMFSPKVQKNLQRYEEQRRCMLKGKKINDVRSRSSRKQEDKFTLNHVRSEVIVKERYTQNNRMKKQSAYLV